MKYWRLSLSILVMLILFSLAGEAQYTWKELGSGTTALNPNAWFLSTTTDPAGNVYGAGLFTNANGKKYVAKWNGTTWSELGNGANALNANDAILSITADATGNIYAAGYFTNANGYRYVAKWNGSTWAELGSGVNALKSNFAIYSIIVDPGGNVYAAGDNVAKWNGTSWVQLGTGANALKIKYWPVNSLLSDPAGNIYAAGHFTYSTAVAAVAKWDGTTWAELGSGANALNANGTIEHLAIDGVGNIYAAGAFNHTPNGSAFVAKWDGSAWSEIGTGANSLNINAPSPGSITTMAIDKLGNIYVAGSLINSSGYRYVAKWDGLTWSELGTGCDRLNANLDIASISISANDDIYAAGLFWNTNGKPYVAQYIKTNTVHPTPAFTQVAPVCSGSPISPLPTKSLNGFTGSWSPALDNTKTTIYTFTPGADQCASTATMTIVVNTATTLPIFTQVAPVCSNSTIGPLPGTSLNGITGTWSPALDNTTTKIYTFTPNSGQCAANTTMTIVVSPAVTPTFGPIEPVCSGTSVDPLPSTSIENITGTWSPVFNNNATTTYKFTPASNGQCATTGNITVTVNPSPKIVFNSADTAITPGSSIILHPVITGNIRSLLWSPSTYLNSAIIQQPTSTPQDNITYTLTASDTNGCSTTSEFRIGIYRTLFMPSAFTPNGDGKDDLFRIPPAYQFLKVYYLSVFNRFGKKVFSTQNAADGWDGKVNGLPQNSGVYVWCVQYQDLITNKTITQQGAVVLIR